MRALLISVFMVLAVWGTGSILGAAATDGGLADPHESRSLPGSVASPRALPAIAAPAPVPPSVFTPDPEPDRTVTAKAPALVDTPLPRSSRPGADAPVRLASRPAVLRRAPPRGPPTGV